MQKLPLSFLALLAARGSNAAGQIVQNNPNPPSLDISRNLEKLLPVIKADTILGKGELIELYNRLGTDYEVTDKITKMDKSGMRVGNIFSLFPDIQKSRLFATLPDEGTSKLLIIAILNDIRGYPDELAQFKSRYSSMADALPCIDCATARELAHMLYPARDDFDKNIIQNIFKETAGLAENSSEKYWTADQLIGNLCILIDNNRNITILNSKQSPLPESILCTKIMGLMQKNTINNWGMILRTVPAVDSQLSFKANNAPSAETSKSFDLASAKAAQNYYRKLCELAEVTYQAPVLISRESRRSR